MIKVEFRDRDDYLREVVRDAEYIERRIIRLVSRFRAGSSDREQGIEVVSTAVVNPPGLRGLPNPSRLLLLEDLLGDVKVDASGNFAKTHPGTARTIELLEVVEALIRKVASKHDLEVRGGVYGST